MFLATTALKEFWDPADELMLLGPWCSHAGLNGHAAAPTLADPWRSAQRYEEALRYCEDSSERMLAALSGYLREALGLDRGPRYWRIILYPWLIYHLQQMYDHYVSLQDAFARRELRTILLQERSFRTPRDINEFTRLALGDAFNLQVYSQLLKGRGFAARALDTWPTSIEALPPKGSVKLGLKRAAFSLLSRAPGSAGQVVFSDLHLSREENLSLMTGSRLKAIPYFGELPLGSIPAAVMDERRAGLGRLPSQDEFEKLFVEALPRNFPSLYLEGHAQARRTAIPRGPAPKVVFTGVGWHYSEAFKFAAAEWSERGSRLWGWQHGGGYGYLRQTDAERLERAVCDRYYTWGWSKLDADPRLRDLPPPQFARVTRSGPGEGLFLVVMAPDVHNIRLLRCSNGELAADYIAREARFWNGLPASLRSSARLRLPRKDWGWGQEKRLRAACPDLALDDSAVPFTQRLSEGRLFVFDLPTTTFLEAFAADAPSILTWNPDAHSFRASAAPCFDALKRVGILFDEPEAAAAQAARVYGRAQEWWNEPERRAAHRKFAELFARRDDDWLRAWLRELENLDS